MTDLIIVIELKDINIVTVGFLIRRWYWSAVADVRSGKGRKKHRGIVRFVKSGRMDVIAAPVKSARSKTSHPVTVRFNGIDVSQYPTSSNGGRKPSESPIRSQ